MLQIEDRGAVRYLTMNAPERLNALSDEMLADLTAALTDLQASPIRAVVLSGSGRAFCAGHDLKQMTAGRAAEDGGAGYFKDLFDRCAAMMRLIREVPQPVIAQVHGIATAAGCQLVASCDMAVAASGTRFGVNGVNIGLFCSTPMVALSRNISRKKTFEMLTTGRFLNAQEALEAGLLNRVVAPEDLEAAASELAETVASKLGAAVKLGKSAYYKQLEMGVDAAYAFTGDVMVENMLNSHTEEGIKAFLEKRDPDWAQ